MANEDIKKETPEQEIPEQEASVQDNASAKETARANVRKGKEKKNDAFQKQIDELNDKLAKEKDDYVRLMAEFETFRRRNAEDRLNLVSSAAADTIKGLLPVLDDCERAMQLLAQSSDEAAKEGTSLIYTKLLDYLKSKGLAVIESKGKDFDTDFHEAVTQFPAPSPELKGKVIDVVQTGYTLNGKVLRYAKVVVGA